MLEQMSKIPAAFKSWKSPATDIFADQRFFSTTPDSGLRWQLIVKTLIDAEKTAFADLLGEYKGEHEDGLRMVIYLNRSHYFRTVCEHIYQSRI